MEPSSNKWPHQMSFPFRLGDFEVFPETLELRSGKTRKRLEPKIMDLLVYFSARPGRVLSKERILAEVWGGTTVVEEALQRGVSVLRKALGDEKANPRYLETIPKKGYRLVLEPHPLRDLNKNPSRLKKDFLIRSSMIILIIFTLFGLGAYFAWREFFTQPIETPAPKADPR